MCGHGARTIIRNYREIFVVPFRTVALAALWLFAAPQTVLADPALPAAPATSEENSSYTIERLIAEARRNNRDLQAARYGLEASRARVGVAGAHPDPRLELGAGSDAPFGNEGEYDATVGISQDFSIGGRIARQQDVARIDSSIVEAGLANQERQLAGDVEADAWRLVVIDRRLQVRADLIAQTEALSKATQTRYKAAEVSELDVNAVLLDLQQQKQALRLLEVQRQALVATLNARLGRPTTSSLTINDPLPERELLPSLDLWLQKAAAMRPDLRGTALAADRARAGRALAEAERWEDWTAGVAIRRDKLVVDGAPPQSAGNALQLNLSIPLPLFSRNRARIAEANAQSAEAGARNEALRQSITTEIGNAWHEATVLQQQLGEYRDQLMPVAARSVVLAQKGYADGLASMPEVLQAQRQNADVNGAWLDILDQFLQAISRLHIAAGDYGSTDASAENDHGKP